MTSYTKISVGDGCEYQHVMTHEIGHVVRIYALFIFFDFFKCRNLFGQKFWSNLLEV